MNDRPTVKNGKKHHKTVGFSHFGMTNNVVSRCKMCYNLKLDEVVSLIGRVNIFKNILRTKERVVISIVFVPFCTEKNLFRELLSVIKGFE